MELPVYKLDGTQSGETVVLKDEIFAASPKDHLIHQAVLSYLAAQRQGTHLARNRSLIRGSGRKPYRQKGTGRARAGTAKSNIWRGGGKSFGPKPHKYSVGINNKEKKIARRSALTYKTREKRLITIEDFSVDTAKTRFIVDMLSSLNISSDDRTLIVVKESAPILWKSCRNIKNLTILPAYQLCTYDIIRQARLIIQKSALEHINEVF